VVAPASAVAVVVVEAGVRMNSRASLVAIERVAGPETEVTSK
jgi:hypothetical protein